MGNRKFFKHLGKVICLDDVIQAEVVSKDRNGCSGYFILVTYAYPISNGFMLNTTLPVESEDDANELLDRLHNYLMQT